MFDYQTSTFLLAGPVKMHPRVINAMNVPALNHRSEYFKEVINETEELFKYLFQTKNKVAILTGSGTAGIEASVSSLVREDDKVLSLSNGKFGERIGEVSEMYSKHVFKEKLEWGKPFDLDRVEKLITENNINVLTFCHNETSCGITNQLNELMKLAKKYSCYTIVDGITSVGGIDVKTDDLGIDLFVTGSQKCLAAPPGVVAVAVSPRAEERLHDRVLYLGLKKHLKSLEKQETPWTPATHMFLAVREALRMIKEEGLENRIKNTTKIAEKVRNAVYEMGLELYPPKDFASNTVTAIRYPKGVDDKKFREDLLKKYNVVISGGQEPLKGVIFRIGHMGIVDWKDVSIGLTAISEVLNSQKKADLYSLIK
ncbi:MAG: pyridoxal-phosphate-dependent aminotransferase family protein [Thermoplasmata archaeon]